MSDDAFPLAAPAFTGGSRSVPAGNAFEWLRTGWALFTGAPGVWIAIAIIMMILLLVVPMVPLIGWIASPVLTPIIAAGALHACRRASAGETAQVGDLFWGFSQRTGPLAMLGLIYTIGWIAIVIVAFFVVGGGVLGGLVLGKSSAAAGTGAALGGTLLALLFIVLTSLPLIMGMCYAPPLVAFHEMAPVAAMKASIGACLKNIGALTVLGVVLFIAAFIAALPIGLGMLIFLPVATGAFYASYRDVFPAS